MAQEYTGIDAGRLELMEERLAEDVRREAAKHGRVLVAREVLPSSEQASATIQDFYETLSGALHDAPGDAAPCRDLLLTAECALRFTPAALHPSSTAAVAAPCSMIKGRFPRCAVCRGG